MVKKKSFWLILLTVLTAVVLAFCACGLAGCSSESDGDETKTEGNEGGGDQGSGDQGSGSGSGSGSSDSGTSGGSGSGSSDSGTSDSFTLQGIYTAYGSNFWGSIEFDEGGTGYFGTYWGSSSGALYESFSGDITWEYTDADETEIEAEMTIQDGNPAIFPVTLHKVDGNVVSGTVFIEEISSESIFYEASVAAALESKGAVSGSHAQLVLNYDLTGTAVIADEVQSVSWEWTTDKDGVSVTIGSSIYSTTSAVVNGEDQITQAVFGTFVDASDITFLQIGDEALLDTTVATFVSEDGYTLVLYEGYVFETTVDGTSYTGEYNPTSYTLDYNDGEKTYTPTVTTDEDGNPILTYATYFGEKTNVVFTLQTEVPVTNFELFYYSEEHGEAITYFTGSLVSEDENGNITSQNDTEYWTFLYRDGAISANVSETSTNSTDGIWNWSENDDNEWVLTITRNPGATNQSVHQAYQDEENDWHIDVWHAGTSYSGSYYMYDIDDISAVPAGSFAGVCTEKKVMGTDDTVYLTLNQDGTFDAHIGASFQSTGVWSKDEDGEMKFYKTSNGSISALCEVNAYLEDGQDTGLLEVKITNAMGDVYTYIVDPSGIPVGGYTYTEAELAKIEELEAAAQDG